jgi:hypothetical protein
MKTSFLFLTILSLLFAGCAEFPEYDNSDLQDLNTDIGDTIIDADIPQKPVTITVSIENGVLVYKDDSGQKGQSILTSAGYGVTIVWKADVASGVKDITSVNVQGDLFMLNEKPRKISRGIWEAKGAYKGEGEITYSVEITNAGRLLKNTVNKVNLAGDPSLPIIRLP